MSGKDPTGNEPVDDDYVDAPRVEDSGERPSISGLDPEADFPSEPPPPEDHGEDDEPEGGWGGPLAWMVQHGVAANLLMFAALVAGLVMGLARVKQEVFPDFEVDVVRVTVPYPGASPAEVEQGIALAVEEEMRGIDGVKRVSSLSVEGSGTVVAELLTNADPDQVLADIKAAVDRITSFPEDAEKPITKLVSRKRRVIDVVISGDQDLRTLHSVAERFRNEVLTHPDITQVEVTGAPPLEVSIEVSREKLEAYGLSLPQIAQQVRLASLELPGGEIETSSGELLVRVSDRAITTQQFEEIVLRGTKEGFNVRLGDIATVKDGFQDTDQASFFEGQPAMMLTAYRIGDETPKKVAAAVRDKTTEFQKTLPDNVKLQVLEDDSKTLSARLKLLQDNAVLGIILVLVILAMFLRLKLAFWVALGIPISFATAVALMPAADMSINLVTSFAFIVTLGIVVDDAIVVGENVYYKQQQGLSPMRAAVEGTREMASPITFAVLTTLAAFGPLFLVPGVIGKIFSLIPTIVLLVLMASLVESFFILPAHLSHTNINSTNRVLAGIERGQDRIAAALQWVIDKTYRPSVRFALRQRYIALAIGIGMIALMIGVIRAGLVPFSFFPKIEGNRVTASAKLPYGAPEELAEDVRRKLEVSARQAINESGGEQYFVGVFTKMGEGPPGQQGAATESGGHLVTLEVNMVPTGERTFTSADFAARWRKATPSIAGLDSLSFNHGAGPGAGEAVNVQLSHPDQRQLEAASQDVTEQLLTFNQLMNVENTFSSGKPQLDFTVLPAAQQVGLTGEDIARQLRAAFFGAEALREQRGRNEVRIFVRLPTEQRRSEYDLENLRLRTPEGGYVYLRDVARFERNRAPTVINREEGLRIINVKAELAPGIKSSQPVLDAMNAQVLPQLKQQHPGLEAEFVGAQRNQAEAFGSLRINFLLALGVIYVLLAIPFRSYLQPLIVMSAIPFGIVGAVIGHLVLGYEMSISSMFGIIALSGVVVNDSLVLIHATNSARKEGMNAADAVTFGGMRRFRPILLTSLTTSFGLLPMMLETDVQARFLVPMAISLGFGVLFATFIILLLVPALYLIIEDLRWLLRTIWSGLKRLYSDDPQPVPGE